MLLEANIGLILAKTACLAKFQFSRFGPEKLIMGIFGGLYLGIEKSYRKSDKISRILGSLSTNNDAGRFSVSPPLHPEN